MNISIVKLDLTKLDKKLQHLDENQLTEVISAYYNGEKIQDILSTYEIKTTSSGLARIFPPVFTGGTCKKCTEPLLAPLPSRTYSTDIDVRTVYCSDCGHQEIPRCSCTYCKQEKIQRELEEEEKKKIRAERKRQFITNYFQEGSWTKTEESFLSLEDKVYLSVLFRSALSEDTKTIEPLESIEGSIAPTPELEKEIIRTLTGRNILVPSSKSSMNAFDTGSSLGEEVEPSKVTYFMYKVHYHINLAPHDGDYDAMVKRLMYPDIGNEEGFEQFCYEMWKRIALSECLQYLLYQMEKVGYTFNPGEKTINVFEELLEHFSVSQIYNIIYRSVAISTKRYQAREITKIHAQNSVISSCESYGQRAIAQGWKLTHYSRVKDLPESFISQFFFTSIMQISDLGFSETPTPDV